MKRKFKVQHLTFIILLTAAPLLTAAFTDNSDGTVTDGATGLVWQKCSRGQTADATCSGTATTANWQTALTYCKDLTLNSRTWRLPSINELKTIVDRGKAAAPMIDTTAFPATVSNYYWSASSYLPNLTFASRVTFGNGFVSASSKTTTYNVRCVSTGP